LSFAKDPGIRFFWLSALGLFLLRITCAFVSAPPLVSLILSILLAAVFVGLPIIAIFKAAESKWTFGAAGIYLAVGAVVHVGCYGLGRFVPDGVGAILLLALLQLGLLTWCMGLGAMLALAIKDKNLMVPVALFLAGFDAFLVFAPAAPTHKMVAQQTEFARNTLMTVPKVQTTQERAAQKGPVIANLAQVGPADLFFTATFFVCIFKFGMRKTETLKWLLPVLLGYLFIVIFLGGIHIGPVSLAMLPAMVPIGATVLLVNAREFAMKKDEKLSTVVVALIAIAIAGAGLYLAKVDADKKKDPASQSIEVTGVELPSETNTGQLPPAPPSK